MIEFSPTVRARDVGYSAGSGYSLNGVGVDADVLQAREQPLGEKVGAERRDHVHGGTQLGDGYRLVGALASVEYIEAAAENGLAPQARRRGWRAHATRSILMLPTTNNLFSTSFPRRGPRRPPTERISLLEEMGTRKVEARAGIEPAIKGFADLPLTAWVPRHSEVIVLFTGSHLLCAK